MVKSQFAQVLVSKLRKTSTTLKDAKEAIAAKAVKAIGDQRRPVSIFLEMTKMYVIVFDSSLRVLDEFMSNDQLRSGTETLVANTVQDVSYRLNELANLVDSASKNEAIKVAFSEMYDALYNIGKGMHDLENGEDDEDEGDEPKVAAVH